MFCNDTGCPVIEHMADECPMCRKDESGVEANDQYEESLKESQEAVRFEEWAHGGNQDDWDDETSDEITFNDAGEPIGYC